MRFGFPERLLSCWINFSAAQAVSLEAQPVLGKATVEQCWSSWLSSDAQKWQEDFARLRPRRRKGIECRRLFFSE